MTQPNTCNRCLQEATKINKLGQCPKCARQCQMAVKTTIKGRGMKLADWHELMKKEGGKVFS